MAIRLFHIRDSSECANVNGPNTNSPLYDNKAGRNRRSTKWQPLFWHQNGNLLWCREKQDVQTCSQATLSYCNKSTHSYKVCSFKKAGNKPRKPNKSSYIDAWRPIGWGGTNKSSRPDYLYSKLHIPITTRLEFHFWMFFPLVTTMSSRVRIHHTNL